MVPELAETFFIFKLDKCFYSIAPNIKLMWLTYLLPRCPSLAQSGVSGCSIATGDVCTVWSVWVPVWMWNGSDSEKISCHSCSLPGRLRTYFPLMGGSPWGVAGEVPLQDRDSQRTRPDGRKYYTFLHSMINYQYACRCFIEPLMNRYLFKTAKFGRKRA